MKARLVVELAAEDEANFRVKIDKNGVNVYPDSKTDIAFISSDVVPITIPGSLFPQAHNAGGGLPN